MDFASSNDWPHLSNLIRTVRMKTISEKATAADYMQRDVVTVSRNHTLRETLELMTENHVTGLPVMDKDDRCVGLITASDILNYEQESLDDAAEGETVDVFDSENEQWESVPVSAFGLERMGEVRVEEVMTSDLVSVTRETPLAEAARRLVDERVHRLLVMGKNDRLYGVLSAFDFAKVVADGAH
jgi:CBS domain-containing protein